MFGTVLFYIAFLILGWRIVPNKKLGAAISFIGFVLASMDFLCLQILRYKQQRKPQRSFLIPRYRLTQPSPPPQS